MHTIALPSAPPALLTTLGESRAPVDAAATLFRLPSLLKLDAGKPRPILLAPGFKADEASMAPLGWFLNKLGHQCFQWGLGRNQGEVDEDIVRLGRRTLTLMHELEQPLTLIGWSLGGVVAREVARLFPETVCEVITLGTPITGGPKYTAPGKFYARRRNLDMDAFEDHILQRNQAGFDQPVTSIYSKSDGIVAWEASVDVYNKHADNVEVKGAHLGLGVNHRVWRVIAAKLERNQHLA